MSALEELRKRVEAATGADRALDEAILQGIGYLEIRVPMDSCPYWALNGDQQRILPLQHEHPTASLDAVLALVGEKLPGWHVNELHQRPDEPLWWADLLVREIEGPPGDEATWRANAHAETPALALLSALLAALDAGAPASAKNEDAA